ncbi:MAG TPA: UDP-glucose/GDP-mannose dehydrogenase family protein [Candidatus Acidoferrales bacterium]|nr:UDP-glucose/GDP-mannose dehydrogenase family protein [Candidatus Acidoferrales bacterium]
MNIAIVGTGYVGLVSGTCFAESGNEVICVDIDSAKIAALQSGKVPFYEPGLEELVRRNLEEQRLVFTTDLGAAVKQSLVIFIAVGTPQDFDGSANLRYVFDTARAIAGHIDDYKIIVGKSTVPPGTAERIKEIIAGVTSRPFAVASNPEFLKEGAAVDDFMKPDRIIIGADDPRAIEILKELHEPFVRTGNPILVMDTRSAEMSKYAANAMLATKISFMNEMAALCEKLGADIEHVRRAIGLDRRIGPAFIFPGVGYGGSCFPKDVRAMVAMGEAELELPLLRAVDRVNEFQKRLLPAKVKRHFGGDLAGRVLAVWGLSFKPRTDDMREAPSITVIESLLAAGAKIQAYDPRAMDEARKIFGERIVYARGSYEAARGADALLIVTEWNEFRSPNFRRLKEALKQPVIFDGRNLYDPGELGKLGFTYYGIGRGHG